MTGNLTRIAKLKALPAIAILASCLLLADPIFNCCRFNESFAAGVSRVLQSWGLIDGMQAGDRLSEDASSHLGCHALTSPEDASASPLLNAGTDAGNRFAEEQSCISEFAFATKAQLPSSLFALFFPGTPRPSTRLPSKPAKFP